MVNNINNSYKALLEIHIPSVKLTLQRASDNSYAYCN